MSTISSSASTVVTDNTTTTTTNTAIEDSEPISSITITIVIPILGSLCGIITILVVYFVTRHHDRLPNGVSTPPISLLGCNSPEHELYQIGFTLTGLLLAKAIRYWKFILYPKFPHNNRGLIIPKVCMILGSYMAVIGVIGQGLVTLEEDFLTNIKSQPMGRQSINHQILALIFFSGAAMHCYATIYVCLIGRKRTQREQYSTNSESSSTAATIQNYYSETSVLIKVICAFTSLISWPIAERLHPLNVERGQMNNKRGFAVGGLAQYITVISYIVFFGSYSLDFYNHHHAQQKPKFHHKQH